MKLWRTSDGHTVSFNDMLSDIKVHVLKNGLIYVGTDSFISKSKCTFASAICLHGADGQSGGKYFFRKVSLQREKFSGLSHSPCSVDTAKRSTPLTTLLKPDGLLMM